MKSLSAELVENIVCELDLESIKSLRSTCKQLGELTVGPRFRGFLVLQETDLSKKSLERLAKIASHPTFSQYVYSLRVTAVVYDTSRVEREIKEKARLVTESNGVLFSSSRHELTEDELEKAKDDLEWLQIQRAIGQDHSDMEVVSCLAPVLKGFCRLSAIKTDCVVYQRRDKPQDPWVTREWPSVFQEASKIFQVVIISIMQSKSTISTLEMFQDTRKCSVGVIEIAAGIKSLLPNWIDCTLPHLKIFSISIASKVPAEESQFGISANYRRHTMVGNETTEELRPSNFRDFVELLRLMSGLEDLNIHMYKTYTSRPRGYEQLLSLMTDNLQFLNLKSCSIRGFPAEEQVLLGWLAKHPKLEHLELAEIHFTTGIWPNIFEHISKMAHLQTLKLSNLWSPVRLESFRFDGEVIGQDQRRQSFPCMDGAVLHTRKLSRHEFAGELRFAPRPQGPSLGSPQASNWLRQSKANYGPP